MCTCTYTVARKHAAFVTSELSSKSCRTTAQSCTVSQILPGSGCGLCSKCLNTGVPDHSHRLTEEPSGSSGQWAVPANMAEEEKAPTVIEDKAPAGAYTIQLAILHHLHLLVPLGVHFLYFDHFTTLQLCTPSTRERDNHIDGSITPQKEFHPSGNPSTGLFRVSIVRVSAAGDIMYNGTRSGHYHVLTCTAETNGRRHTCCVYGMQAHKPTREMHGRCVLDGEFTFRMPTSAARELTAARSVAVP